MKFVTEKTTVKVIDMKTKLHLLRLLLFLLNLP